jgi:hypothetical protein
MPSDNTDFPENSLGIKRGTVIRCNHPLVEEQLGIKIGAPILIGFNGEYVICGPFTWSIEQLVDEITSGYWVISGQIDLSDPDKNLVFSRLIERISDPEKLH